LARYFEFRINENTLFQTVFLAILPTGIKHNYGMHDDFLLIYTFTDGHVKINKTVPISFERIFEDIHHSDNDGLKKGGNFKPIGCRSNCSTAIIIPYKNREAQLKVFLKHMHPILQRQQIDYRIFVIEQNDKSPFNRAKLFNVGYSEATKTSTRFTCFVFHDVDLLLENEFNDYCCLDSPRYMCPAIDVWGYQSFSPYSFGGVVGISKHHLQTVNGYSNRYWGWGSEDDDLFWRLHHNNIKVSRPPLGVGRYSMMSHAKQAMNGKAILMLKRTEKGVLDTKENGLSTLKYQVTSTTEKPLFTHVLVDLLMTESERNLTDVRD